jgi:hypothetical protein
MKLVASSILGHTGIGTILYREAVLADIAMGEGNVVHAMSSEVILGLRCTTFVKLVRVQCAGGTDSSSS